jgi:hypothetical protein
MKEEQFKHLGEAQFHADFIFLFWLSLFLESQKLG